MTCADLGSRKILPAAVWRAVHSSQDRFGGRAGRLRRGAAVGLTELGPGRAAELGGRGKTFGLLATQEQREPCPTRTGDGGSPGKGGDPDTCGLGPSGAGRAHRRRGRVQRDLGRGMAGGVPSEDVAVGVCGDQVARGVRRPRGIGLPGDGPGVPCPRSATQEGPASSRSEP